MAYSAVASAVSSIVRGIVNAAAVLSNTVFSLSLTTLSDAYGNVAEAISVAGRTRLNVIDNGVTRLESVDPTDHVVAGARVVENLLSYSEDFSAGAWIMVSGSVVVAKNLVDLPVAASHFSQSYGLSVGDLGMLLELSGSGTVNVALYNSVDGWGDKKTIALTATPTLYYVVGTHPISLAPAIYIGRHQALSPTATAGTATQVGINFAMVTNVTGLPATYVPEYVPRDMPVGAELVTNGAFDTDISGWTDQSTGGSIAFVGGSLALQSVTSYAMAEQTVSLVVGQTYLIALSVSGPANENVHWAITGGGTSVASVGQPLAVLHTATAAASVLSLWETSSNVTTFVDSVSIYAVSTGRQIFTTTSGNTVSGNVVTEGVGAPLHPTQQFMGSSVPKFVPAYAAGQTVLAGGSRFDAGKWYTSVLGGTASGATLLTDTGVTDWVEQGLYQSPYGILVEGAATNLYPSPEAVATQTVTLALGDNVLSVYGTGALATTDGTGVATGHGTATEGTDVVLTVTAAGTFTFTLTGTLTQAMLETGNVSSSFTATARADSMGAIKWSTAAPAFGGNGFPHARGNVMVAWQPQFNSGDLVAADRVIVATNNAVSLLAQQIATVTNITSTDGTASGTATLSAWNRNDAILLDVRFGLGADPAQPAAQRLQLGYANVTQGDTAFTIVASVPYDGAFTDTGFMQLLKALGGNSSVFGSITVNDTPATDAELNGLLA